MGLCLVLWGLVFSSLLVLSYVPVLVYVPTPSHIQTPGYALPSSPLAQPLCEWPQSARGKKQKCVNNLDYYQLINYMKELRLFFQKEYDTIFILGKIYQGDPNFSYLSLTTDKLKKQKLKFVIILNHKELYFSICLSGQNKSIRKKYWEMFRDSDWNKFHLAESIDNSLSIINHTIRTVHLLKNE